MDVLGHNIANVNTYGFKKSRVSFQDILSQTISGAAAPTAQKGGVNPRQVGLGMTIASIDKVFTQGSLQTTGLNLDLAIQGDGFFIVNRGEETYYTRSGAFALDRDGTLVNPANGMRVQGWQAVQAGTQYIINTTGELEDLIIPVGGKDPAKATEFIRYRSNLDANTPLLPADRAATAEEILNATVSTNIDVYDSEGNVHTVNLDYIRVPGEANSWRVTAAVQDADPDTLTMDVAGDNQNDTASVILRFDSQGAPVSIEDSPAAAGAPADIANEGNLSVDLGFELPAEGITQTINLDFGAVGNYEGITQFAAPSTTRAFEQDGYGLGYLESFTVDDSGVITGIYTNGKAVPIGQVAMAIFTNPQGLNVEGDNNYRETNNSGIANVGEATTGGRGKITAGTLEMSNVDLAEQFTDMIVTQRGFQANSRSITTSDQMLQELLTLKR
jgi:flagellar hook protein FlgE